MSKYHPSHELVVKTAEELDPNWNFQYQAQFEYFNPNGSKAAYEEAWKELSAAVDAGEVKSGALLAYDSNFHDKAMATMVHQKAPKAWKIRHHANSYRELATKIRECIARQKGEK